MISLQNLAGFYRLPLSHRSWVHHRLIYICFEQWTRAFIGNLSQQLDEKGQIDAAKSMLEFQQYFIGKMDERRQEPKDDILSKVVNASIDGEKPLENAECMSMISQIMVAGNETTSASLTEGMWHLIQNSDQYHLVRNDHSEKMILRLVEETLRLAGQY